MKVVHLFGEQKPREPNRAHSGPIYFTCPHCNTAGEMKLYKMIFKSIDFECQTCHAPFKLTNPEYVPPPKKL